MAKIFNDRNLLAMLLIFCFISACECQDEKTTHLSFYFHEVVSGRNQSVIPVMPPARGFRNMFGAISITDDPLTEGPDMESQVVGSANGMYVFADRESVRLLMAMNFVFDSGRFSGSSLSLLGSNQVLSGVREMPIVGGSGSFRLARGYALASTYSIDSGTGNIVVHYDITVMHP